MAENMGIFQRVSKCEAPLCGGMKAGMPQMDSVSVIHSKTRLQYPAIERTLHFPSMIFLSLTHPLLLSDVVMIYNTVRDRRIVPTVCILPVTSCIV